MENYKYKNYIYDLGVLIKEKALEAKQEKTDSKEKDNDKYIIGYLMAYHEIIDLMKQQATNFDIKQNEIGLDGINPEIDLI